MFGSLKSLLIVAALLVSAAPTELDLKNGYQQSVVEKGGRLSVNALPNMPVKIDAGWYSFAYGNTGTLAYRSFGISNSQVVQFEITSCFCPGNFFSVYDNGQPIIITSINPLAPPTTGCDPNTTDPNDCAANNDAFSQGLALLLPGTHNVTIVVRESPYHGGTAFVRVDTVCTQPDDATNPNDKFSLKPCCIQTNTCATGIVA